MSSPLMITDCKIQNWQNIAKHSHRFGGGGGVLDHDDEVFQKAVTRHEHYISDAQIFRFLMLVQPQEDWLLDEMMNDVGFLKLEALQYVHNTVQLL